MAKEVTRWACCHERCRKTYSRKNDAERHESICVFNPQMNACPTCKFDAIRQVFEEGCRTIYHEEAYCSADQDRGVKPWVANCGWWEPTETEDESDGCTVLGPDNRRAVSHGLVAVRGRFRR